MNHNSIDENPEKMLKTERAHLWSCKVKMFLAATMFVAATVSVAAVIVVVFL